MGGPFDAVEIGEDHLDVAGELPQDLAARAARRRRLRRVGHHGDAREEAVSPLDTALNIATRSAHIVRP